MPSVVRSARRLLRGNRQRGRSDWDGRDYDFVCPSPSRYPFQWFWDSAFHAIALLHVDAELAKQELRCLLQAAQPDGFIPHMVLWDRRHHEDALREYSIVLAHPYFTATIQPPVLARAIWRIYEATGDLAFVREALPPTCRFFDWLAAHRDPDGDHLIAIIQPDESGLDASPKYDVLMGLDEIPENELAAMLPVSMQRLFATYAPHRADQRQLLALNAFNWEDVMVNAIYADGLDCLVRLSRAVRWPATSVGTLEARRQGVVTSLMEKCWDERFGAFWDLAGVEEHQARTLTFTSLFPLIIESMDRSVVRRLVDDHLLNPTEFWLPYPIPSVAATERQFDPTHSSGVTWRGLSWVNVNWYLYWALRHHGYNGIATELAQRTIAMVSVGGMREFFNPYTAEGRGAQDFGWTALVLDLIAAEWPGALDAD